MLKFRLKSVLVTLPKFIIEFIIQLIKGLIEKAYHGISFLGRDDQLNTILAVLINLHHAILINTVLMEIDNINHVSTHDQPESYVDIMLNIHCEYNI